LAGEKDAKIEKARQLAESGKFAQAIDAWRQLLDETPHNDANVYNTIGDLCLKNKATPDAIDAYGKAARFYLQEGFHLKAIALYKKILKFDPNRAEMYTLLGDLNVVRGLLNNAVADYLSGAKMYLKIGKAMNALTLFRKITKVDPQNTDMRLRVAELCLKEKLTEEAIDEYLRIGRDYQRAGRHDEATKLYEQILKISPGHAEARRRLDNPLEPVAEAPEPTAPSVEELTVSDAIQSAVALETPTTPEPALATVEPPVQEVSGEATLEFKEFKLEEPVVETPPAPAVPVEIPRLDLVMEAPAAAPEPAAVPIAEVSGAEEKFPGARPGGEALQAVAPDVEAMWGELHKGTKGQIGDEDCETHYDLGVAYKEMGLVAEAVEELRLAARGPTRFVDACTMIAACYKDQSLNKPAIAFLERVLADAGCVGPSVPYVKYDLAVLYEEEGFADKAIRLYEDIPSIRDVEARLRRLQGSEEPTARPPAETKRPISYL
jgi:tetratricopeptide (TPR) repeat protein